MADENDEPLTVEDQIKHLASDLDKLAHIVAEEIKTAGERHHELGMAISKITTSLTKTFTTLESRVAALENAESPKSH